MLVAQSQGGVPYSLESHWLIHRMPAWLRIVRWMPSAATELALC